MTTIATDGKTMAADGLQAMCGTIVSSGLTKIWRLKDGSLYGGCGTACDAVKFAKWLDDGAEGEPPKLKDDFGCVIVRPNGIIETCGDSGFPMPVCAPVAMGSGMDIAIGAMDAGASPERAIEIASQRDKSTGGVITVLELHSKPKLEAA